jgi:hypothetical protein
VIEPAAAEVIAARLEEMKAKGSSIVLNWAEDDNLWECSWISSGKRYTGFHQDLRMAIDQCWMNRFLSQFDAEFSD